MHAQDARHCLREPCGVAAFAAASCPSIHYERVLSRKAGQRVDLHSQHIPIGCYPIIVLDCWEHSYYRDYLSDRKTYAYGMMKELDWKEIDERFKKAEKIAKV